MSSLAKSNEPRSAKSGADPDEEASPGGGSNVNVATPVAVVYESGSHKVDHSGKWETETAINKVLDQYDMEIKLEDLNPCYLCVVPLVCPIFVALLLFFPTLWVAEFVFSILGLVRSADIMNAPGKPELPCLKPLTDWFIVFASFFFFTIFLGCCCTGARNKAGFGKSRSEAEDEQETIRHIHFIHLFLVAWVIYGFSLLGRKSEFSACNANFFDFFELSVNFLFWGGIAILCAIVCLSPFVGYAAVHTTKKAMSDHKRSTDVPPAMVVV